MDISKGYKRIPFSPNRKIVAASLNVSRKQNSVHAIIEADITEARSRLAEYREKTGTEPSITAYGTLCLAKTVKSFPGFNSVRKGNYIYQLEDITIGVLVERNIKGESVPEPVPVHHAGEKTYSEICSEIRSTKNRRYEELGESAGTAWINRIPSPLLGLIIKAASGNLGMKKKYGVLSVSALGMFSRTASWFIPVSSAAVSMTIGGIKKRVLIIEGQPEEREILCTTLTFDHDLFDGAPIARFVRQLTDYLETAEPLDTDVLHESSG